MVSPRITEIASRVADEHGAHTAILYGSYARGDATEASDLDLLLVRENGPALRDTRLIDEIYLDGFVYPETAVATPDAALLRLVGGRVLRDKGGFGAALLERVRALHERGPEPLPSDQRQALEMWARKTLSRVRDDPGPEGEYRRMHFLVQSLEDYFTLRKMWFRGSKEAFAWLQQHDPAVYSVLAGAMRRTASDEALARVVRDVYGEDAWNRSES
jgi:predicted nucleotidyltransferase